jgi:hypothetical protein
MEGTRLIEQGGRMKHDNYLLSFSFFSCLKESRSEIFPSHGCRQKGCGDGNWFKIKLTGLSIVTRPAGTNLNM